MKKILILISFLLVIPINSYAQELNIICDIWPPYQEKTDSGLTGYSVELVRAVTGKMNADLKPIKDYPWKRAVYMIQNGQTDALFSANYTKEREEFAYYPKEPLIMSPWVIWVKADSGVKFDSYSDLTGKSAGVVRGYSYTDEFWSFLKSKGSYQEVADDATNFRKLNAGRIQYTVAELGNGFYIMKQLGIKGIKPILTKPIKEAGLFIMFNKDRVEKSFVDNFSNTLKDFKTTKEYELLYNNYFK